MLPVAHHHHLLFGRISQGFQHRLDDLRLVRAGAVQLRAYHHVKTGQHMLHLQDFPGEHLRLRGGQAHLGPAGEPFHQDPHPGVELVLIHALHPVALPVLLHRGKGLFL